MKEIITIINQKGGVGKSTTAHAISAKLAEKGYKTLCIDMDAQQNLTYSFGANDDGPTILEVLLREAKAQEAIQHTEQGDIIPADVDLVSADMKLRDVGTEYRLKEALEPILDLYDYIVIDTPPNLGVLTVNSLVACTGAIVPSEAAVFSMHGIVRLFSTIHDVKKYCNPSLEVKGIVLTQYNPRTILSQDVTDMIGELAAQYGTKVYKTPIREAVAIGEAQARQTNIYAHAPNSGVAEDYRKLVEEILA
jgi:chromosome partitioning protein